MNSVPFDFDQALTESKAASQAQVDAEDFIKTAYKEYATAERVYRVKLARTITELHNKGVAWTVCSDLARGDEDVAELKEERDTKKGVVEAANQAAFHHSANRRDLLALIEWSFRREMAEVSAPRDMPTFGRRAA